MADQKAAATEEPSLWKNNPETGKPFILEKLVGESPYSITETEIESMPSELWASKDVVQAVWFAIAAPPQGEAEPATPSDAKGVALSGPAIKFITRLRSNMWKGDSSSKHALNVAHKLKPSALSAILDDQAFKKSLVLNWFDAGITETPLPSGLDIKDLIGPDLFCELVIRCERVNLTSGCRFFWQKLLKEKFAAYSEQELRIVFQWKNEANPNGLLSNPVGEARYQNAFLMELLIRGHTGVDPELSDGALWRYMQRQPFFVSQMRPKIDSKRMLSLVKQKLQFGRSDEKGSAPVSKVLDQELVNRLVDEHLTNVLFCLLRSKEYTLPDLAHVSPKLLTALSSVHSSDFAEMFSYDQRKEALESSIREGNLDLTELLVQKKADLSALSVNKNTPLMQAQFFCYQHQNAGESKHAVQEPELRLTTLKTVLEHSLEWGENDTRDTFKERIGRRNTKGETALILALRQGDLATIYKLKEKGATLEGLAPTVVEKALRGFFLSKQALNKNSNEFLYGITHELMKTPSLFNPAQVQKIVHILHDYIDQAVSTRFEVDTPWGAKVPFKDAIEAWLLQFDYFCSKLDAGAQCEMETDALWGKLIALEKFGLENWYGGRDHYWKRDLIDGLFARGRYGYVAYIYLRKGGFKATAAMFNTALSDTKAEPKPSAENTRDMVAFLKMLATSMPSSELYEAAPRNEMVVNVLAAEKAKRAQNSVAYFTGSALVIAIIGSAVTDTGFLTAKNINFPQGVSSTLWLACSALALAVGLFVLWKSHEQKQCLNAIQEGLSQNASEKPRAEDSKVDNLTAPRRFGFFDILPKTSGVSILAGAGVLGVGGYEWVTSGSNWIPQQSSIMPLMVIGSSLILLGLLLRSAMLREVPGASFVPPSARASKSLQLLMGLGVGGSLARGALLYSGNLPSALMGWPMFCSFLACAIAITVGMWKKNLSLKGVPEATQQGGRGPVWFSCSC